MIQGFRKLERKEQVEIVLALVIGSVVVAGMSLWATVWIIRGAIRYHR